MIKLFIMILLGCLKIKGLTFRYTFPSISGRYAKLG